MIILALGLKLNPTNIPSVLVNKPTPYFSIPSLETEDKKLTNEMFIGEVNILNIFSSWCIPCLVEHPQMEKLSEYYKIPVYGINYKDKKEDCKKWLKKNGNPYQLIGLDPTGRTSINLIVFTRFSRLFAHIFLFLRVFQKFSMFFKCCAISFAFSCPIWRIPRA